MPQHLLSVSPLYVGAHLVLLVYLSYAVVRLRRSLRIGIGVGDDPKGPLARAVRVHGNFVEHVPIALIGLVSLELLGASVIVLHVLGGLLTLARLAHLVGLGSSVGITAGRFAGTAGTWLTYLGLAGACFYYTLAV